MGFDFEKEKEPVPSANGTSPNKISLQANNNINIMVCQELARTILADYEKMLSARYPDEASHWRDWVCSNGVGLAKMILKIGGERGD